MVKICFIWHKITALFSVSNHDLYVLKPLYYFTIINKICSQILGVSTIKSIVKNNILKVYTPFETNLPIWNIYEVKYFWKSNFALCSKIKMHFSIKNYRPRHLIKKKLTIFTLRQVWSVYQSQFYK